MINKSSYSIYEGAKNGITAILKLKFRVKKLIAVGLNKSKEGLRVEKYNIYQQIAERTQGDIYIGVVGPVRTGKSTFIKRFMDLLVIPNIENEFSRGRAKDELPQSASGRTIMTTEPKFVSNEAIKIELDENVQFKVRLVDCVGYMVKGAIGHMENDVPRMVSTPWFDEQIPFVQAAEIGTKKVINDHSTIGS
ncbi:stage IV sporulation protein A [Acetivibrio straminisolvens JCM 21531]|uniref:Stage IV sporulation protein A n=1 Tax=Acetivibrio straminisolvens JCM 21531 TaxID=1294263 RepID=W4V2X9_9FIRM|nr:stage IV sporulation protein A [Acetivibrio straminisolvens JCM 21531]